MHAVFFFFFFSGGGNCVPFSVCSHGSKYSGGITGSKGKAAWNGPSQPCLSVPELNRNFLSQQRLCLKLLITSLNLFSQITKLPSPCASGESRTKTLSLGSSREKSRGTARPEPAWWRPGRLGTQAVPCDTKASCGTPPRRSRESHLLRFNPPTWILAWSPKQSACNKSWYFPSYVSLKSLTYTNPR